MSQEDSHHRLQRRAPPSLGDKARRGIWNTVWLLFFRPSPVPFHAWRRMLLRRFGASIGSKTRIYPSSIIWAPWNLTMAPGSCLGPGVNCYSVAPIVIGSGAIVSQRSHLCSATHDFRDKEFSLLCGKIIIEANVWVAAEAFIGAGVTVNENAVVGARAVVTRDVPSSTIVAGNPARSVGRR